jgi:hypothetical protein
MHIFCANSTLTQALPILEYTTLSTLSLNAETHEMLEGNPGNPGYCQIVIGTDFLSVGVGMPARLSAILICNIDDTDEVIQKFRRVGRNSTQFARGIIYVTPATRKAAEKALADDEAGIPPKAGKTPMDLSFPQMIVAKCKVKCQDSLYNNPVTDPLCTCPTCPPPTTDRISASCNCSGCLPEKVTTLPKAPRASRINMDILPAHRLSKLQRKHGRQPLLALRLEIWRGADQSKCWLLPLIVYFSDGIISSMLENFALLNGLPQISTFVKGHQHLEVYAQRILEVIIELKPQFAAISTARKAENAANLQAKRAAEALAAANGSDDKMEDVEMQNTEGLRYIQLLWISTSANINFKRCNQCCE